jgi:5'-nucleotidase
MRILLTNDDGIFAPGIIAMYNELVAHHHVDVVAPETVQSGGSHAITIRSPVMWQSVHVGGRFQGTSVNGSPADCVKLALNALLPQKPDLVVSGINAGLNTGIHVLYSGTVAAALEGAILGCPAVAVSLQLYRDMDFARAARLARGIIEQLLSNGLAPRHVFNINVPEFKAGWPRGIKILPQSTQSVLDKLEKRHDPGGREYYWLSGDFGELDDTSQTDLHAVREGFVCLTPLHLNLTDNALLSQMQQKNWTL